MHPYSPRVIRFSGLRNFGGWTLKLYSVLFGAGPMNWAEFEPGLRLAESALPEPDDERGRPGLGFIIAHQGRTADYIVLGWWSNENELPLRVWVRRSRTEPWRPAIEGESICVWDLEVIWAERQAWIAFMMAPIGSDRTGYLAAVDPLHSESAGITRPDPKERGDCV